MNRTQKIITLVVVVLGAIAINLSIQNRKDKEEAQKDLGKNIEICYSAIGSIELYRYMDKKTGSNKVKEAEEACAKVEYFEHRWGKFWSYLYFKAGTDND